MRNNAQVDIISPFQNALNNVLSYLPQLIAGIIILLIGLVVASILKTVVQKGVSYINFDKWLGRAGVKEGAQRQVWGEVIGQLVFWTVFLTFLIPAADSFGIPRITELLNQLVLYLPNIFASIIIIFAGMVISNLLFDVIRNSARGFGARGANIIANVVRYAVIVFASLIALEQLGIAETLIQILFIGFVATVAISVGLAVGLGGQEAVRELFADLRSQSKIQRRK